MKNEYINLLFYVYKVYGNINILTNISTLYIMYSNLNLNAITIL